MNTVQLDDGINLQFPDDWSKEQMFEGVQSFRLQQRVQAEGFASDSEARQVFLDPKQNKWLRLEAAKHHLKSDPNTGAGQGPISAAADVAGMVGKRLPFSPAGFFDKRRYNQKKEKFDKNEYTTEDLAGLAQYEVDNEAAQNRHWLEKGIDAASYLPGFAGEFAATGGVYAAARGAATKGVAANIGRISGLTARTAAIPNRWLEGYENQKSRGNSGAKALALGFADSAIELGSEMLGAKMLPAALSKLIPKKITNTAKMKALGAWVGKFRGTETAKSFAKGGVNGPFMEFMEERVGELARPVAGVTDDAGLTQLAVEGINDPEKRAQAIEQLKVELFTIMVPGSAQILASVHEQMEKPAPLPAQESSPEAAVEEAPAKSRSQFPATERALNQGEFKEQILDKIEAEKEEQLTEDKQRALDSLEQPNNPYREEARQHFNRNKDRLEDVAELPDDASRTAVAKAANMPRSDMTKLRRKALMDTARQAMDLVNSPDTLEQMKSFDEAPETVDIEPLPKEMPPQALTRAELVERAKEMGIERPQSRPTKNLRKLVTEADKAAAPVKKAPVKKAVAEKTKPEVVPVETVEEKKPITVEQRAEAKKYGLKPAKAAFPGVRVRPKPTKVGKKPAVTTEAKVRQKYEIEEVESTSDVAKEIQSYGEELGVPVKYYTSPHKDIEGFYSEGTVYIQEGTETEDALWGIFGHELAHQSTIDRLHELFDKNVIKEMTAEYVAGAKADFLEDNNYTEDDLVREGVARMLQKFMADPKFRDRLRDKNRSTWRRIIDVIGDRLDSIFRGNKASKHKQAAINLIKKLKASSEYENQRTDDYFEDNFGGFDKSADKEATRAEYREAVDRTYKVARAQWDIGDRIRKAAIRKLKGSNPELQNAEDYRELRNNGGKTKDVKGFKEAAEELAKANPDNGGLLTDNVTEQMWDLLTNSDLIFAPSRAEQAILETAYQVMKQGIQDTDVGGPVDFASKQDEHKAKRRSRKQKALDRMAQMEDGGLLVEKFKDVPLEDMPSIEEVESQRFRGLANPLADKEKRDRVFILDALNDWRKRKSNILIEQDAEAYVKETGKKKALDEIFAWIDQPGVETFKDRVQQETAAILLDDLQSEKITDSTDAQLDKRMKLQKAWRLTKAEAARQTARRDPYSKDPGKRHRQLVNEILFDGGFTKEQAKELAQELSEKGYDLSDPEVMKNPYTAVKIVSHINLRTPIITKGEGNWDRVVRMQSFWKEYYNNSLLFNFKTAGREFATNTLYSMTYKELYERPMSIMINKLRSKLKKEHGKDPNFDRHWREVQFSYEALIPSLREAVVNTWYRMVYDYSPLSVMTDHDGYTSKMVDMKPAITAYGNTLGAKAVRRAGGMTRLGYKMLGMQAEFFTTVKAHMNASGEALNQAMAEGLTDMKAVRNRIAELKRDRTSNVWHRAMTDADKALLAGKVGVVGTAIQKSTETLKSTPALGVAVHATSPFFGFAVRATSTLAEMTPGAGVGLAMLTEGAKHSQKPMVKGLSKDAEDVNWDRIGASQVFGLAWATLGYGLLKAYNEDDEEKPLATGSLKTTPGEREMQYGGIGPMMIQNPFKERGSYISYSGIEPWNTLIPAIVDLADAIEEGKPWADGVFNTMAAQLDKNTMQGISDFVDVFSEDNHSERFKYMLANIAVNHIPNAIRQPSRDARNILIESRPSKGMSMTDMIRAKSELVAAADEYGYRYDIFGKKIQPYGTTSSLLFNVLSPIKMRSVEDIDPIRQKLLTYNENQKDDSKKFSKGPVHYVKDVDPPMTPKEFGDFARAAGQRAYSRISKMTLGKNLTEWQAKRIAKIIDESRAWERDKFRRSRRGKTNR